jgi:hypothetical protein
MTSVMRRDPQPNRYSSLPMNDPRASRIRRLRRHWRSIVAAAATAILLATAAASAAASSIEGIWAFGGGQIAIQPLANGTFVGTVVAETTFAECVHPDGQQIWTGITQQPDGSFWGLHQWYTDGSSCVEKPERGRTAWRVLEEAGGAKYMLVCLSWSGPTQPQPTIAPDGSHANTTYGCFKSALIAPLPAGSGGSGSVGVSGSIQSLLHPGAQKCISGRRFVIHLAEPQHDPFKTVLVTLRGRRIRTAKRGDYVDATIDLKGLPLGAFTIKISAKTVLGLDLAGSRTYHTCAKKRKNHKPAKLKAR